MGIQRLLSVAMECVPRFSTKLRAPVTDDIAGGAGLKLTKTLKADTFEKTVEKTIPDKLAKELEPLNPILDENKIIILKELYHTSEEKFDCLYKIFKEGNGITDDSVEPFIKTIKNTSLDEINKTCNEIYNLYKLLPENYSKHYGMQTFVNLAILKKHNKQAYNFIVNSNNKENIINLVEKLRMYNGSMFETLTVPQIKQMQKTINKQSGWTRLTKGETAEEIYTENSDELYQNKEIIKDLHEYLSADKITESLTAFRGERDTGIFSSILLNRQLASKVRNLVTSNMVSSKSLKVHDYTKQIINEDLTDLYSYITDKKNLTLADAMQVAKYGDENFRKQVIELIKKVQLKDTRFKSFTFDRNIAKEWNNSYINDQNTKILCHTKINEGLHGHFTRFAYPQAEIILDNEPKNISFKSVKYDPESDIFYVDSAISKA